MGKDISIFFNSTIIVKQRCSLSTTLFALYIDELEQMVAKFVKEEGIEEVVSEKITIILLLYANNVVLATNTLRDSQKLYEDIGKVLHAY